MIDSHQPRLLRIPVEQKNWRLAIFIKLLSGVCHVIYVCKYLYIIKNVNLYLWLLLSRTAVVQVLTYERRESNNETVWLHIKSLLLVNVVI